MLIQCTKKLLTELKIKPSPATEAEPLFSWHANMLTIDHRKTLVLMNDCNRYVIVLYGLKAKDFKKIDELIVQAIRKTYQEENIKDEVIDTFLAQSEKITFTSTKNKSYVARMNKACDNVHFFSRDLNKNAIIQAPVSKLASRSSVGRDGKQYTKPNRDLYRDLEGLTKGPIFNGEAVILQVRLEMEHVDIWRRIIVPKGITFPDLHQTLQIAFNWGDYHLHEFAIFASKPFDPERMESKWGRIPIVRLVTHEEDLEFDSETPSKMETDQRLAAYLPAEIAYIYDFGDYWNHEISVEDFIDDYHVNHPMCLAGEGNAPPEDVGGENGYQAFLEIIQDPTHPDYQEMENWGSMQGYKAFDIEMINRRLTYL